jgi:hypothetical protein
VFFPKTTKLALAAAGAFLFLFCSVQGIDGRTYSLADVRGPKGTLVVFICNHCPYVKASIGRIVAEAMGGCLGLLGFESAKEFWEHHPLYHSWKFKSWACQFGNRAPPDRGKA